MDTDSARRMPTSETHGPVGLKAVLRILFDHWQVSVSDAALLIGCDSEDALRDWRRDPSQATIDGDMLERLSLILGIYHALVIIIPDERARDAWMTRANDGPVGCGSSPIERFRANGARITDLFAICRYLDGEWG